MVTRFGYKSLLLYACSRRPTDALVYDVLITNSDGECMLELKSVTVAAHTHSLPEEKAEGFDMIHQPFSVDSLSESLPPLVKDDTAAVITDASSDTYVLVHKPNGDMSKVRFALIGVSICRVIFA